MLYRLGGLIARRAWPIVATWLLLVIFLAGGAAVMGTRYDDSFSLPGTESQHGKDLLRQRFGLSGNTATVVFTTDGAVDTGAAAAEVHRIAGEVDALPGVALGDPLKVAQPIVSAQRDAVLGQATFDGDAPSTALLDRVRQVVESARHGVHGSVGGSLYNRPPPARRGPELLGLAIALVIATLTLGSLVAGGLPLVSAVAGVVLTLAGVVVISHQATVSSSSPTLAEMLGLAVGIDYALFLLSRHRAQLRTGLPVAESVARALATAGSAVAFAGATVMIALCGLAVVRIPMLTTMGLAAAVAVAVAVAMALTFLPAVAVLLGERLRPQPESGQRPRRRGQSVEAREGRSGSWAAVVGRHPVAAIVGVVLLLGSMSVPAIHLSLALPDASTADPATPQRHTFDTVAARFGPGYNAPLLVEADIVQSKDPKQTVDELADAIRNVPGVVAVTQATPNRAADTALLQVIPKGGQSDPVTSELVTVLRSRAPRLESAYGVQNLLVTGTTAINIDVSQRLSRALLPFAVVVIGLSLLLLLVVFRSIAVPLKATLGYLLSVGSALGAVVMVFQWGWFGAPVQTGPLVSFLPIFLMGVLFGLAMDYEMFLVSRMREDFVRRRDARSAVQQGFRASAAVVSAAALIMVSVFAAFVPTGSETIRPIAFGLAVGVLVDAFLVRLTLVPAVLTLLGRRAWQLPRWLDARLPVVDVEGAALDRLVAHQERAVARGEDLVVDGRAIVVMQGEVPLDLSVPFGASVSVTAPNAGAARSLAYVLAGHLPVFSGTASVAGRLLPGQESALAERVGVVDLADSGHDVVADPVRDRAALLALSARARRRYVARAVELLDRVGPAVDGLGEHLSLECVLAAAAGTRLVVAISDRSADGIELDATNELAHRLGISVLLVGPGRPDNRWSVMRASTRVAAPLERSAGSSSAASMKVEEGR